MLPADSILVIVIAVAGLGSCFCFVIWLMALKPDPEIDRPEWWDTTDWGNLPWEPPHGGGIKLESKETRNETVVARR